VTFAGGATLGAMETRFDRDTALERLGPNRFLGRIDPGWHVLRGPNGGYVAAIVLRALGLAVDDPARAPRSLTVHYTAPPVAGPITIETALERRGRSLSTVSARMTQEGRLLALALGAFSIPREGLDFQHLPMPAVAPPAAASPMPRREGETIPIHGRYEYRWAVGEPPWSGASEAVCGGWIRLAEGPRAADAALVAAYTDAWPPASFSWARPGQNVGGLPTIDLTIHFRAPLPLQDAAADEWHLAVFRSRVARHGFVEEDGEVWSEGGVLVAQSRQLALIV